MRLWQISREYWVRSGRTSHPPQPLPSREGNEIEGDPGRGGDREPSREASHQRGREHETSTPAETAQVRQEALSKINPPPRRGRKKVRVINLPPSPAPPVEGGERDREPSRKGKEIRGRSAVRHGKDNKPILPLDGGGNKVRVTGG